MTAPQVPNPSQYNDAKNLRTPHATKKNYSTPKLQEFGTLAKLTQNSTGSFGDSGTGMMNGSCL